MRSLVHPGHWFQVAYFLWLKATVQALFPHVFFFLSLTYKRTPDLNLKSKPLACRTPVYSIIMRHMIQYSASCRRYIAGVMQRRVLLRHSISAQNDMRCELKWRWRAPAPGITVRASALGKFPIAVYIRALWH